MNLWKYLIILAVDKCILRCFGIAIESWDMVYGSISFSELGEVEDEIFKKRRVDDVSRWWLTQIMYFF